MATPPPLGCPKLQTARINWKALLLFCNNANVPPPNGCPCDTPNESDSLQELTSNKIYHLFGNRWLRTYENFWHTFRDAKFVKGGEPCPLLGKFANIHKQDHGKARPLSKRYLDKVPLDIV